MQRIGLAGVMVSAFAVAAAGAFAQSGTMMAPAAGAGGAAGGMMSDSPQKAGTMMAEDPAKSEGAMLRQAMGTGHKVAFTDLAAARKLAEKGPVVLFFAADWCPDCRADLKDINANGSRLSDVTVVVADYDKTADVKMMYGIAYQHSYVQIDAKGKALAAWSGGGVEGILKHVVRM